MTNPLQKAFCILPFCSTVTPGGGGPKHFPASIKNKLWWNRKSYFESFPNNCCISRDCRQTGYFIMNMWKCHLLFWIVLHNNMKAWIVGPWYTLLFTRCSLNMCLQFPRCMIRVVSKRMCDWLIDCLTGVIKKLPACSLYIRSHKIPDGAQLCVAYLDSLYRNRAYTTKVKILHIGTSIIRTSTCLNFFQANRQWPNRLPSTRLNVCCS
jgi:hypothetical protein